MFCRNCAKELVGNPEICMNCGAKPSAATAFCPNCGNPTTPLSVICPKCGAGLGTKTDIANVSQKSRLVLFLLALFLGQLGIHRYYAGKTGSGVAMLVLTIAGYATMILVIGFFALSVVWVWNLIDVIMAVAGTFKDKEGKPITSWGD